MPPEEDTEAAPHPYTNLLNGYREYITATIGKCDTILKSYTQADKVKIKKLHVILKERADILKDLEKEILDLIEKEDEIEGEIQNSSKFVEDISETLVRLDETIEDCENEKKN